MDYFLFYLSLLLPAVLLSYEVYRLPDELRTRYHYDDIHLQSPRVNGYGGPVGRRVMIPCKVQTRPGIRPEINWFRRIPNNATCHRGHRGHRALITSEGRFCPEERSRFLTRSRIKFASRLVIRRPQQSDSGLYLCRVSGGGINITLITKLEFHEIDKIRLGCSRAAPMVMGICKTQSLVGPCDCSYGGEPRYPVIDYPQIFHYPRNYGKVVSVKCALNSTTLTECRGLDRRRRSEPPAGITCRRSSSPIPSGHLRVFGNPPLEGRVEIYRHGFWGTLCMKGITENEISTICRALGYNFGGIPYKAWVPSYQPGTTGVGPVMLTGLQCPPVVVGLDQCIHGDFGVPSCNCTHDDDLAIRCHIRPEQEEGVPPIRLTGYDSHNKGRVELYHNGSWGTINAFDVHAPEANVFCKMAGFPYGGEPFVAFRGFELMWINSALNCPLDASRLKDCSVTWDRQNRPYTAGGVICREQPLRVPDVPFRIKKNYKGTERLQYFSGGYWGLVCGLHVGSVEASMICSMMGHQFGGSFSLSYDSQSLHGFGPVLMKYLDCPLNSTTLDQCGFRDYKSSRWRTDCYSHAYAANIRCFDAPTNLSLAIRLIGNDNNRGVLEVYQNGRWRLIDGSTDNPALAAVVCRQLGFNSGGETFSVRPVEANPTGRLDCSGNEDNVGQCTNLFWDTYLWFYDKTLGVECYESNTTPFTVSLREIGNNESAIVLNKGGESYLLCANKFDEVSAQAYCLSVGYSDGIPRYFGYSDINMEGKFVKAMYCQRGTVDLRNCFHTGWDHYECDLGLVAGVTCLP